MDLVNAARVRPEIVREMAPSVQAQAKSAPRACLEEGDVDRTDPSEAIVQDVNDILAEELRAAGPELLTVDLEGMEARLQQLSRRVCGATLERVLAVRALPRGGRPRVRRAEGCYGWWTGRGGGSCRG